MKKILIISLSLLFAFAVSAQTKDVKKEVVKTDQEPKKDENVKVKKDHECSKDCKKCEKNKNKNGKEHHKDGCKCANCNEKDKVKHHEKEHVCTASCTPKGHAYKHGEKGHVCSKDCDKFEKKK